MEKYDVIVIGAGHAGIEAAHAAASMGVSTLLLTIDIDAIGKLSCNPAVGGVSKGCLVREVDALGGLMGKIADEAAIGYRFLNRSKGKAVWATRAQVDKYLYPKIARRYLEQIKNLSILQAKVKRLITKNKKVTGIETNFGHSIFAPAVIICAGTFLKSTIHIGMDSFPGGRLGEESSDDLFENICKLKIATKHFKTGTCARLDSRSIDYGKMEEQKPETDVLPFSFFHDAAAAGQHSCWVTRTNVKTHAIIRKNLKRSPLYTGKIKACGVRYCPSLEDKIVRFGDREGHHVFIEPEGRDTLEVYPNGVSTSLPFDVQESFIRTIAGLEHAVILRPGYGIEHGLIDARELDANLESKKIAGLFFAGQVNGTTGYEEAAAQGLMAGINAALRVHKKKPFVLQRHEAYIAVMIEDLTSKGTDEPYRMFTSRCEFRLSVRESNAVFRLGQYGKALGLIDSACCQRIAGTQAAISAEIARLRKVKAVFEGKKISLYEALCRPNVFYDAITQFGSIPGDIGVRMEAEIMAKYEGFLHREDIWKGELAHLDRIKIPAIDFRRVPSLSKEVIEKLMKFKPATCADALRISGVTPAAIVSMYGYIKKSRVTG